MSIHCYRYRSSEDEKDEKKSKKKRKKDEKSKKKSKKSKKAKKTKKAKHKKDSKKKKKKKKVSSSSDSSDDSSESDVADGEDVWVEKSDGGHFKKPDAIKGTKINKLNEKDEGDDESQVGPSVRNTSGLSHKDFGHALLPGEGAAMVSDFIKFRKGAFGLVQSVIFDSFL